MIYDQIKNFIEKLSSRPVVAGLELSDASIRFARIEKGKLITASLRLPPGIIVKGRIMDRRNFLAALEKIRSEAAGGKAKQMIQIVVSLPPSIVFTQSFSLPRVASSKLEEAAALNLQMISPLESNVSYSDWQLLHGNEDKLDVLGAFTEKSPVDEFNQALRETGFLPAAFEFPALSLTRVARNLSPLSNFPASFIVVSISGEGLDTFIVRSGSLYFSYFRSWESIQAMSAKNREITLEELKDIISLETSRVINFASSRFNESPLGVVLITPGLEKDLADFIQKDLKLKVFSFRVERYGSLSPVWYVALGAALRGLIAREEDVLISLSSTSAEEEFFRLRLLSFISLWRGILSAALVFFILVMAGALFFTSKIEDELKERSKLITSEPDVLAVAALQKEAVEFNRKIDFIASAETKIKKISPLLAFLNKAAAGTAVFDKIMIQAVDAPVQVKGRAASEKLALSFKDILAADPRFSQVTLPLSGISALEEGVSFSVSFVVKDLNFSN